LLARGLCRARSGEPAGAARELASAAQELLGFREALVFLAEDGGLVCRGSVGVPELPAQPPCFAVGEGPVGRAGLAGSSQLWLENGNQELTLLRERLAPLRGSSICPAGTALQSALVAPLRDTETEETLGVLVLVDRLATAGSEASTMASFPPSDAAELEVLLYLAAHSIQENHRRRRNVSHEAFMRLLKEVSRVHTKDLTHITSHLLYHSHDMFECDRCTFFVLDTAKNEYMGHYHVHGEKLEEVNEITVPRQGIVEFVSSTGELVNIPDAWSDRRFSKDSDVTHGFRTRSMLCAPLTSTNGKVIGVLQCINKQRGSPSGTTTRRCWGSSPPSSRTSCKSWASKPTWNL
jgi:hypothetical protein